jgi:hypothetical protein
VILSSGEDGCHEIMWDIVRQWKTMPNIQKPSREECATLEVTEALFKNYVVAPWYRTLAEQVGKLLLAKRNSI